jgi:hypothetical protein
MTNAGERELSEILDKETSVEEDIQKDIHKEKSDLLYTLALMLDDSNIKGKTILNNRQVTAITLMNMYGQIYDIPFLKDFVEEWCRYRISGDNGRGRTELIEIAQAIQLSKDKEHNNLLELLQSR